VILTWQEPFNNYDTILEYLIEFREVDGDFSTTLSCDGSMQSTINTRTCTVALSVFRSTPYSLTYGMLVAARIKSRNQYGWSAVSQANTGDAIILTMPAKMSIPVY